MCDCFNDQCRDEIEAATVPLPESQPLTDLPRNTRIYISSKMTGLPEYGFSGFYAAEEKLREMGFKNIFNPARNEDELRTKGYIYQRKQLLTIDFVAICHTTDAVVVFGRWRESVGACMEVAIARELEKPVFELETLQPPPDRHIGRVRTSLG